MICPTAITALTRCNNIPNILKKHECDGFYLPLTYKRSTFVIAAETPTVRIIKTEND